MFRLFTALFAIALLVFGVAEVTRLQVNACDFPAARILANSATAAAPDLKFDGKIVVSDKEKLVLLAGDEQQEFMLTPATKIMLNGQEAAATDLMAGQMAMVSAQREEARMKALTIAAFSPK